jgi:DivIVA domain-containing protein
MDISAKILREVEFRDRLRGYDTDEVDDFLERVAVGFDELTAELNAALARADRAEHQAPSPAPAAAVQASMEDTSDSIKRTLVLAQRTADLAVREAQDEASKILEDARAAAAAAMSDARSSAELARSKAEQDLRDVVDRLSAERARLETEVASLVALISSERTRLTNTLKAMLVKIDDINVSPEVRSVAAPSDAASSAADGPGAASAISSAAVSPLGGLLAEPDDDLEPEDEEELDLHFALPDPPRPLAEDAARAVADNSFRERLADPLDPDEELWDRWARTGENQVVGGDDSSGEAGRNN